MELPLSYFSNEKKGDIMSRMSTDVGEIQWSILRSLENLVRSPIMIFGSLAMMLYISPLLTGFSFGLFLSSTLGCSSGLLVFDFAAVMILGGSDSVFHDDLL
jgi:ABC-type multidrug transport system fused ATPase/permease subunit